jgi:replicative DNA helicase
MSNFLGDKIPPNDLEAEKITLSAMMQSPEAARRAFKTLDPDDYYYQPYRQLFALMRAFFDDGKPFDWFTVKRAVEAHHGTVSVQSTPGRETKFTIQVPRNPPINP